MWSFQFPCSLAQTFSQGLTSRSPQLMIQIHSREPFVSETVHELETNKNNPWERFSETVLTIEKTGTGRMAAPPWVSEWVSELSNPTCLAPPTPQLLQIGWIERRKGICSIPTQHMIPASPQQPENVTPSILLVFQMLLHTGCPYIRCS